MNALRNNISQFQNGGMKSKCVVDNLFIGTTYHILRHTEKCFDSLWLEDCKNSLWENGIRDGMLSLIYLMNTKIQVTIKNSSWRVSAFHLLKYCQTRNCFRSSLKQLFY